ncbi:MAG: lactoylglutathione lyase [Saprospiraceae bacterium]|nr:lactoylglutathione lyase [Saprospiraceae bacterium]
MFILYVENRQLSSEFYSKLMERTPELDVPGMTEFRLSEGVVLGLMPNSGIARILAPVCPHPVAGTGIPRCELYFRVQDADRATGFAVSCGAALVQGAQDRDWGDRVGYVADPDGHIIALACPIAHTQA